MVREPFGRRVIREDFAATVVDCSGRHSQICPVNVVKRFPLGVDAPQFTVEVFVGPTLSSVSQPSRFLYTFPETGVKRDHEKGNFLPITAIADGNTHVERSEGQYGPGDA